MSDRRTPSDILAPGYFWMQVAILSEWPWFRMRSVENKRICFSELDPVYFPIFISKASTPHKGYWSHCHAAAEDLLAAEVPLRHRRSLLGLIQHWQLLVLVTASHSLVSVNVITSTDTVQNAMYEIRPTRPAAASRQTSWQRILTKGCTAGVNFSRGQCNVTPTSQEHCSRLQQSRCHAVIEDWKIPLLYTLQQRLPMVFNWLDTRRTAPSP